MSILFLFPMMKAKAKAIMITEKVLKLDQSYSPVQVIDWKKAIILISLEKAEIIAEYDKEIRTPNKSIKCPAVIRLIKSFPRHSGYIRFNKKNVFARDDCSCMYCGIRGNNKSLTMDHIVPRSIGGKTSWTNCVACCKECNKKKADNLPEEVGLKLIKQPFKPDYLPFIMNSPNIPEVWRNYYKERK